MTQTGSGSSGQVPKKRFTLIVDDDPRDLHATSLLAQNFGYTATTVKSVEEAIEFLSIAAPALVITELRFPGMTGFELLERVKRDAALKAIPVIVHTGLADLESEERCRRIGCAGFVRKPLNPDELYRAIQSAIEATPRQYIRAATHLRISIDGAGSVDEFISVLSDKGLFIKTLNPRPAGSRHTITFMVGRKIIRTEAAVLYAYGFSEGPSKEPGMGMKFLDLSVDDLAAIRSYIQEQVRPGVDPAGR